MTDELPEPDEHGFAPTKIVRVRWSAKGNYPRFYRVWMKPADLAFPPQERRLYGEEQDKAMRSYTRSVMRSGSNEERVVRLSAGNGTMPRGYATNSATAGAEEGGSPKIISTLPVFIPFSSVREEGANDDTPEGVCLEMECAGA